MSKIIITVLSSNSEFYDYIVTNYWKKMIKYIEKNNLDVKIFLMYS